MPSVGKQYLDDWQCSLISNSFLCRCQAADLSKNGIGVKGSTALVEALKQNETLQTLILDTNSIGDEGAEILAKHLSSRPPLIVPIPGSDCFFAASLLHALCRMSCQHGIHLSAGSTVPMVNVVVWK